MNSEKYSFSFNKLGCKFENVRTKSTDMPMCTLIEYVPIKKRKLTTTKGSSLYQTDEPNYSSFLRNVNPFSENPNDHLDFYRLVQDNLKAYGYTDSILMAFDGYEYFKRAGYDFLIRSDMDVFLTPLFAKWLPVNCNDFYVGRGGYSNTFNSRRFQRIAFDLGLKYHGANNLGKLN